MQKANKTKDNCSVLFTMRYPDNTGYVWNTIAQSRDVASQNLQPNVKCFLAFPKLTGSPSFEPKYMTAVELDCYDYSVDGLVKLTQFVREHNVKVMVFMSALPSTVNLAAIRRLGVRTINTENDSFDHSRRDHILVRVLKFIARRILRLQLHDLHLANAESQYFFLSKFSMIPISRLALVRDGVDCDRFIPGDKSVARKLLALSLEKFWIISVAQARPEKRLDLIIKTAKKVFDLRPARAVGFVFIGDGPTMNASRELARELDLGDRFIFAGHQKNLVPYYQAADLMVHAATRESFGLAIVEAMSCGIPVVASAAAGPSETIIDGQTGAIVEVNDEIAFLNSLLRYVDNQSLVHEHGQNASRHVLNNYSLKHHGCKLANHINSFL